MIATDTKSQILAAAVGLFALHGYEKTTMRAIAKKVGIQAGSIYHFFDSKESLLQTIFSEFESDFAKHRNPPDEIFKVAQEKPLPDVLQMMFYTFGSPSERDRMMAISRVILSLQYENVGAQQVLEQILVKDAMDYGVCVLKGLHALGIIKEIDFARTAFIFHSFAVALFQDNLRHLKPGAQGDRKYKEGIAFISSQFAQIIGV